MKFVLLVTWIASGQPPQSYQTPFSSLELCQSARASILSDAERMKDERAKEDAQLESRGIYRNTVSPMVTAVCVAQ